jgi:DNA-binding GntR family transcriptional regulator
MKVDSLSNKVYTEIRRQILIGQLIPKTWLKEDFWAKKLSVGRMAVREGLTRLLGEGLVSVGGKGGFYVAEITTEDLHQIREVREILELGALRLLHKKITEEQFKLLDKICDDFTSMVKMKYYAGACEADIRFHETLMECSGNNKLFMAYKFCHIPLFHQKLGKTKSYMDDYEETDHEHRALVKALKEKNINLAEEILIAHFNRGEKGIIDLE